MSGICGWTGYNAELDGNRNLIERMAQLLGRFDGSRASVSVSDRCALAAAALNHESDTYQDEEFLVAVIGQATYSGVSVGCDVGEKGLARALARGYQRSGVDVLKQITGSFAVALINQRSNEALFAVDRMGIHSLSFGVINGCLLLGSSLDVTNLHPIVAPELDLQSIYNYMYFHVIPAPATIYKQYSRLLPGHYGLYQDGQVKINKYWEIEFIEHEVKPFEELKVEFIDLLHKSVKATAQGEKVGAFLSGGTDSSTLAGILSKVNGSPTRTYSIGFDEKNFDEMSYARIAAAHFSTHHHELYVTAEHVTGAIPKIAEIYDQPFGNSSAVPTYYCARLARADGIERLLGGDGGDELFGGNERYAKQHVFSFYTDLPLTLRDEIIRPIIDWLPSDQLTALRKLRSYIDQASIAMPARLESYNLLQRFGFHNVFTSDFLEQVNSSTPISLLEEIYYGVRGKSLINHMLALDHKFTLADNDLPKVVKTCELAQISVGFPLLNDDLVAFSARLSPDLKLRGTKLRYFFKEALRGFLPKEILTKKKHGFGLPFGTWLMSHKPLMELVSDSLNDLRMRNIVRSQFIDELIDVHVPQHAHYYSSMVWILMMMEQWFERHLQTEWSTTQKLRNLSDA